MRRTSDRSRRRPFLGPKPRGLCEPGGVMPPSAVGFHEPGVAPSVESHRFVGKCVDSLGELDPSSPSRSCSSVGEKVEAIAHRGCEGDDCRPAANITEHPTNPDLSVVLSGGFVGGRVMSA